MILCLMNNYELSLIHEHTLMHAKLDNAVYYYHNPQFLIFLFRQNEVATDVETAVEDTNDVITDSQHALNDGIAVATAAFNNMAAMTGQMMQQMMGAMAGMGGAAAGAPAAAPAAARIQQAGIAEMTQEVTADTEELNDDAAEITEDMANVFADTLEQGNAMAGQMFGGLIPAMGGAAAAATAPPAAARRMQRF
jgi:predicted phage tail protein